MSNAPAREWFTISDRLPPVTRAPVKTSTAEILAMADDLDWQHFSCPRNACGDAHRCERCTECQTLATALRLVVKAIHEKAKS